jgi:hypothetical protein
MEKIRVAAQNFWSGFYFDHSVFTAALRLRYDVEIVDEPERADMVFESHWDPPRTYRNRAVGKWKKWRNLKISGKRVFFSAEPFQLPVGTHHGVISYHLHMQDPHHFRFPVWMLYCDFWKDAGGRMKPDPNSEFVPSQLTTVHLTNPTKFACTVFGNRQHLRFKAPQWLGKFGKVDIFGTAVGIPTNNKMEILPDYKFNLCFENTIIPGYTTEKAIQAKVAVCIPLYWGDPAYRIDFNEKSVINIYEYDCDFQRIFDEVDLEEVRQTPILSAGAVPLHLLDELSLFLESVMRAPQDSVF